MTVKNAAMVDDAGLLNPLLKPDASGLQQSSMSAVLCSTGWTGIVEVEAHVVTIKNAAMADDAGLLNPLLKRWQDQACSTMVFGLPAVQSVINFKWDRRAFFRLVCVVAVA